MHESSSPSACRRKKQWAVAAILFFTACSAALFWFVGKPMLATLAQPEQFRIWVDTHGVLEGLYGEVFTVYVQSEDYARRYCYSYHDILTRHVSVIPVNL